MSYSMNLSWWSEQLREKHEAAKQVCMYVMAVAIMYIHKTQILTIITSHDQMGMRPLKRTLLLSLSKQRSIFLPPSWAMVNMVIIIFPSCLTMFPQNVVTRGPDLEVILTCLIEAMRILRVTLNPSTPSGPLKDYTQVTQVHTVLSELENMVKHFQEFHMRKIEREWRSRVLRWEGKRELAPNNSKVHDFEGNNNE